jgi:hypothetical protein
LSDKVRRAAVTAIEDLTADERREDTAVIDGLIMVAVAIKFGFPVTPTQKTAVCKALVNCEHGAIASELFGPP